MALVNAAHSDNENQVFSMLGVIGTLGTADVQGTARTLPIGVNPDTGAMYVDVMDTTFNVGTLTVGTINKVGTVSELTNGSVKVTAGTVSVNTPGTITSGTISVNTPGTITSGSIAVIAGSIVGTVSVNTPGTITSGSIAVTAGTVDITPLAGVVLSGTVGIGTTATAIPASALSSRKSLIVYNCGTSRISLGGASVGTLIGLPLGTADYSPSFDLGTTILYGIADTAGGTVIVLEVS